MNTWCCWTVSTSLERFYLTPSWQRGESRGGLFSNCPAGNVLAAASIIYWCQGWSIATSFSFLTSSSRFTRFLFCLQLTKCWDSLKVWGSMCKKNCERSWEECLKWELTTTLIPEQTVCTNHTLSLEDCPSSSSSSSSSPRNPVFFLLRCNSKNDRDKYLLLLFTAKIWNNLHTCLHVFLMLTQMHGWRHYWGLALVNMPRSGV